MPILFLLRGLALGFSIAAPVGPIGVLCIRRTLTNGYLTGVASGMGAATADMLYGAVAAFGLSAISGFLLGERLWIHLIGAVFLGYLGLRTLLARPKPTKATETPEPADNTPSTSSVMSGAASAVDDARRRDGARGG